MEKIETAIILALSIAAMVMWMEYIMPMANARGPYWVLMYDPVKVTAIVDVEDIRLYCPTGSLGCFYRDIGVAYLKKGMNKTLYNCVLGHEALSPKSHANGWYHPEFPEPSYAVDCGDGTIVPGELP